jgi:hypothetical protein
MRTGRSRTTQQLFCYRIVAFLFEIPHSYRPGLLSRQPSNCLSDTFNQLQICRIRTLSRRSGNQTGINMSVFADSVSPRPRISAQNYPVKICGAFFAVDFFKVLPHTEKRVLHRLDKNLPVACQPPKQGRHHRVILNPEPVKGFYSFEMGHPNLSKYQTR